MGGRSAGAAGRIERVMSALCRVECVMSNFDRYGTFFLVTPDLIRGPWARRRWDGSRIKFGMTKKANVRSPRPRGWLSSGDGDSRRLAVQSIDAHRDRKSTRLNSSH